MLTVEFRDRRPNDSVLPARAMNVGAGGSRGGNAEAASSTGAALRAGKSSSPSTSREEGSVDVELKRAEDAEVS